MNSLVAYVDHSSEEEEDFDEYLKEIAKVATSLVPRHPHVTHATIFCVCPFAATEKEKAPRQGNSRRWTVIRGS